MLAAEEDSTVISVYIPYDSIIVSLTNGIDVYHAYNTTALSDIDIKIQDSLTILRSIAEAITPITHFDSTAQTTMLVTFDRLQGLNDARNQEKVNQLALKCPEYEGMAVYVARGLSTLCARLDNNTLCDNVSMVFEQDTSSTEERVGNGGIKNNFNIFPNPTNNLINIFSGTNPIKEVRILNSVGYLCYLNTRINSTQLQIDSKLSPGYYLIEVLLFDGTKRIEKIIINDHKE